MDKDNNATEDESLDELKEVINPIIKVKKPRSDKQKAALVKAQEIRKKNKIARDKEKADIQKEATKIVADKQITISKASKKKKKKKTIVYESASSSSSSSSSSEEEIVIKKKKGKKKKKKPEPLSASDTESDSDVGSASENVVLPPQNQHVPNNNISFF